MLLKALRVRHFRNLARVEITPHERFNLLVGPNGQGKTNLLEAIYLLSAVKSFRHQTNQDLIEFGQPQATLEARVDRGGQERIVTIEIGERGKRVLLNNNPVRHLSDFFGTLNVVMFGPEDISLLKGGPSERRRFIDRAIFNAHPGYAVESSHYEDVLKQRNALLKQPGVDRALLEVYDEQLIQYGAEILMRRLTFLREFVPVLQRIFSAIFDQSFEAGLRYQMAWAPEDAELPETIVEAERLLASALSQRVHDEMDRGHTLVGPHRDDLVASINEREVRAFASQGQHRAFVLAMKIAEITYLEERFHFAPILLLDDVSSELDRARNNYLFDFLRARLEGQVFITTTHRDYIQLRSQLQTFDVRSGEIAPQPVEEPVETVENDPDTIEEDDESE